MVTRRGFLQGSAAVGASAALSVEPTLAGFLDAGGRVVAVVDQRVGAGRQFNEALRMRGIPVQGDDYDPTAVLARIAAEYAPGGYTVVGLTQMATFLIAERTGLDNGLQLAWRGEHRLLPDGRLQHQLRGSSAALSALDLEQTGDSWAYGLGQYLVDAPLNGASEEQDFSAQIDRPQQQTGSLVSWVLTPRG